MESAMSTRVTRTSQGEVVVRNNEEQVTLTTPCSPLVLTPQEAWLICCDLRAARNAVVGDS